MISGRCEKSCESGVVSGVVDAGFSEPDTAEVSSTFVEDSVVEAIMTMTGVELWLVRWRLRLLI